MDTGLLIKGREEVKEQKSPISPFKKRASQENLAVAKAFKPLSEEEVVAILAKAEPYAEGGLFEPYKKPLV